MADNALYRFALVTVLLISALALSLLASPSADSNSVKSSPTTLMLEPDRELLETTHEACSNDKLKFSAKNGYRTIRYSNSDSFPVRNGTIIWYCGGNIRHDITRCPQRTNFVEVVRSQGRDFTVRCYDDPALGKGPSLLETTAEACSEQTLTVVGRDGGVKIPYSKTKEFPVSNGEIIWYCGASRERTGCPAGTNYVKISRGGGRTFTVRCYRR